MSSTRQAAAARREASRAHGVLAQDIRRLREDSGITLRQLAEAAGIDASYLGRIEDGRGRPSLDTYARLALALGADLASRLYPNTGPAVRDRHQSRILEALISYLGQGWKPYPEVAVRHPARGWIDVLLHARLERLVVACEIESALRRLEQLIRWFGEKVASLSSWEGLAQLGDVGPPSKLLVVRATRTTRATGREFERQLRAAYPAHPADALAALAGGAAWPGSALVWARIDGREVRFLDQR
jgi:transcriptional regulator with XRE-family HTH domain